MSRAEGKHNRTRTPDNQWPAIGRDPDKGGGDQWPATGEDAQIGASTRTQGTPSDIPGGRPHITNAPAVRHKIPTPVPQPEVYGVNAHGVRPGSFTTHDRADLEQGRASSGPRPAVEYHDPREPVMPVPVYLVTVGGGQEPLRTAYSQKLDVPSFAGDPIKIVGRDVNRTKVRLRNVGAVEIAVARSPAQLVQDLAAAAPTTLGGANLGTAMTSYQDIETSDELWAVAVNASTAATLFVIAETAVPYGA